MPVTLPRRGPGSGGPGRRGERDGGRGRGGRGGPLPCRERNPMLASNSRNSTLATSISPLPYPRCWNKAITLGSRSTVTQERCEPNMHLSILTLWSKW